MTTAGDAFRAGDLTGALAAATAAVKAAPTDADARWLTDGLGTRWATAETSFKFHASCRHTHPAELYVYLIEGEIVLESEGQPDRVMKTGDAAAVAMECRPLSCRRRHNATPMPAINCKSRAAQIHASKWDAVMDTYL